MSVDEMAAKHLGELCDALGWSVDFVGAWVHGAGGGHKIDRWIGTQGAVAYYAVAADIVRRSEQ